MWPYWLLYLVPALIALAVGKQKLTAGFTIHARRLKLDGIWIFVWLAMTLFIGFRFEVGGDWGNYLRHLSQIEGKSLVEAIIDSDPGYRFIEWLSLEFGWGIYGTNLISAGIFSYGLAVFCRSLPRPWLALASAVPYLVLVLGMGYTRQGVALGCEMMGIVALFQGSIRGFLAWLALATTFHKTALVLVPLAALVSKKKLLAAFLVVSVGIVAYMFLLGSEAEDLYSRYVGSQQLQSEGALVRLLMNAVPAAIFLVWRRRFVFSPGEAYVWRVFAVTSLGLLVVYSVMPASTAVDQIALYLLPLQLVVFARFPEVFSKDGRDKNLLTFAVVLYYALVQFVWLNYATNASAWLPYSFYPFED